jgi:predicted nucleic acid-binding protein
MSGCVLDTDVVIATLDRRDANHGAAAKAMRRLIGDGSAMLLSTVNYAEALVRPADDPAALWKAVDAIDALGIELVPPTPAIARDAARLRGAGVSLPDGFAVATARARGATLASFDKQLRQALRGSGVKLAPGLRP